MLQTFIIALREGVEAALVVAIAIAYLKKIDRRDLLSSVYRAFVAAVFASFLVAIPLALVNVNQDRYEGWLLVVSAVFVLSMVVWMNRHAKALMKLRGRGSRIVVDTGHCIDGRVCQLHESKTVWWTFQRLAGKRDDFVYAF